MSSKKKKQDGRPMPASSAGLLRFFEDETPGIKIRPEYVMAFAVSLIVASILLIIFLTP
jgi:preprotein translocase subunit Sec61beta